jgi:hypothetical protein
MKIVKKILAGAAILGMALSVSAVEGGAARASTVPVVYADANPWQVSVEPGRFYFGQGGAPYLTGLRWTSWNGASAWATGRLRLQEPGCTPPVYECPFSSRWVGVYLNTTRWHDGTRYYARMAAEFWYAGKWRWDVGWFTSGFWTFSLTYPYL